MQSGTTFYVSSGTVLGPLNVNGVLTQTRNVDGTGASFTCTTPDTGSCTALQGNAVGTTATGVTEQVGVRGTGNGIASSVGLYGEAIGSFKNYAAYLTASGGSANHALSIVAGDISLNNQSGTSGQVLTSQGANSIPAWTTPAAGGGSGGNLTNLASQFAAPYYSFASSSNTISGSTGILIYPSSITVNGAPPILSTSALQSGATFYVSSGTVSDLTLSTVTVSQRIFVGRPASNTSNLTMTAPNGTSAKINNIGSSSLSLNLGANNNDQLILKGNNTVQLGAGPFSSGLATDSSGIIVSTPIIVSQGILQSGATFYVSSGTIDQQLSIGGAQNGLVIAPTQMGISTASPFNIYESSSGTSLIKLYTPGMSLLDLVAGSPSVVLSTGNLRLAKNQKLYFTGSGNSYVSFRSTGTDSNVNWILPSSDASGCWQSDGSGNLSISPCPGSGGASTLEVLAGTSRSSPTITVGFPAPQFQGSVTGSSMTVTLANVPASVLPSSVAYLSSTQTFTGQDNWTSASASTFTVLAISSMVVDSLGNRWIYNAVNGGSVFLGDGAGNPLTSGNSNVGLGQNSLGSVTTALQDTCTGAGTCQALLTGVNSTFNGFNSGTNRVGADRETAFGAETLNSNAGGNNTAVGTYAGHYANNVDSSVFVGSDSGGTLVVGSTRTRTGVGLGLIGYGTTVTSTYTLTNAMAIGYNATVGSSNTIQLGGANPYAATVNMSTFTASSGTINGQLAINGGANGAIQFTIAGSTYGAISSSATPVVGQYLIVTSTNYTVAFSTGTGGSGGGGGSGTVGSAAANQIAYYNGATAVTGSNLFQINGTSMTIQSSVSINTSGLSSSNSPVGALDVFLGFNQTGASLLTVGDGNQSNQFIIPDQQPIIAQNGGHLGELYLGGYGGTNTKMIFSNAQDFYSQYINLSNSGEMDFRTAKVSESGIGGSMVFSPAGVAEVAISSLNVTFSTSVTIGSSVTINSNMAVSSASIFNGGIYVSSTIVVGGSSGNSGQFLTSGGVGTVPTWTSAAGGGDAVKAATQTFTGSNTFANFRDSTASTVIMTSSGTANVLQVNATGNFGTSDGSSGGVLFSDTDQKSQGPVLQIYSDQGVQNALTAPFYLVQNNTAADNPNIYVVANGTSPQNGIRLDGKDYSTLALIDILRSSASKNGKFQFSSHNNELRGERRNAANNAFESAWLVDSSTGAGIMFIGTDYSRPVSTMDVQGGVGIGMGVAGNTAAPTNGLLVQGNAIFKSQITVSSGVIVSTTGVTGNYTATSTDTFIGANCGTTCTITLPTAVGISGRVYRIKMLGTAAVTVGTTSSQTIDGATTQVMSFQYTNIDVISDGSNWNIL